MITRTFISVVAMTLIALMLALFATRDNSSTSAAAPPFNPGGTVCFENFDTPPGFNQVGCDGDSAVGAASDLRTQLCLAWGSGCVNQPNPPNVDESLHGLAVYFTPGGFVPAGANSVPVGALAGQLKSNLTMGLLNGPCGNSIEASFSLLMATVDTADAIQPKPPGLPSPMEPLAFDANANGIPDGADKYPAFLINLISGAQPDARLFGISKIQNTWTSVNLVIFDPGTTLTLAGRALDFDPALGHPMIAVVQNPTAPESPGAISDFCAPQRDTMTLLGRTVDNPCTPLPPQPQASSGNCPHSANPVQNAGFPFFPCESINSFDEDVDGAINDGCPQILAVAETGAQCTNNTSDDPEDSSVNDGCPGIVDPETGRLPGTCAGLDEGGCVFRKNPTVPGAQMFTIWTEGLRDADADGIENQLDVCALYANGDWNPHVADVVNEGDQDGLPDLCDPDPDTKSGQSPVSCPAGIVGDDQDDDCFANRQDNCPFDNQLMDPGQPPHPTNNVPVASDGDHDGIGDACDPAPQSPNGDFASICLKMTLWVGSAPTIGEATKDPNPGPGCATGVVGPTLPPPPVWGDIDCSGGVNAVDALKLLRHNAGLPYSKPDGCPTLGAAYP
jgi:hypothetical protein